MKTIIAILVALVVASPAQAQTQAKQIKQMRTQIRSLQRDVENLQQDLLLTFDYIDYVAGCLQFFHASYFNQTLGPVWQTVIGDPTGTGFPPLGDIYIAFTTPQCVTTTAHGHVRIPAWGLGGSK